MLLKRGFSLRFIALLSSTVSLLLSLSAAAFANSELSSDAASLLLADRLGSFRAVGLASAPDILAEKEELDGTAVSAAARDYLSESGQRFSVVIVTTNSESAAYALLTGSRNLMEERGQTPTKTEIGAMNFLFPERLLFAKGRHYVAIDTRGRSQDKALLSLARSLADSLPRSEEDIPVLVKHLPDWENVHHGARYFVSHEKLKATLQSPILDAVSFEGGAEAVVAHYGPAKLAIIEFTTPQLATENDGRIVGKLEQLRAQGQSIPAYRRVGNYGVFVFNASDDQTANRLIDPIKYEQVTQWLGDNPYPFLEAQRRYTAQTLGVLVSVVKASGLALITCLTIGGIFGGLLFMRRRAQQRSVEAFSDAGGMIRINLDEMTPQTDSARLLGRGR